MTTQSIRHCTYTIHCEIPQAAISHSSLAYSQPHDHVMQTRSSAEAQRQLSGLLAAV